ncbi:MAG: UvrD-helicase domain-containing protein [Spirochaetaceae bacterium]|nr:UvrD-helicase domain-containing protein [Spirochaetaceae bacterium]
MANMELWLSKLNPEQKEAVFENNNPLLVLAGAGSGKTRVITTKIAYCIQELHYNPWNILAVTFTNKAAKEMKDRVLDMLPQEDPSSFNIRTFHSFGVWLLRRFTNEAGLQPGFTIYDDSDSLSLLRTRYSSMTSKDLKPIMKAILKAKDMGLNPYSKGLSELSIEPNIGRFFEVYEKALREVGNVDFADLITIPSRLMDENQNVRDFIQRRFKVVLVDEYQDSNVAQFELLKRLVSPSTFICVVGDDDQSIYRFRGAEIENILSFPNVFPNTKSIVLAQNYRSTSNILDLASSVIKHNSNRHEKVLRTDNGKGSKPQLYYVNDEVDEANKVYSILKRNQNFSNSAILYRTNAQSSAFETLFTKRHIPYKIVGALKFYDREEVKDALALLQLFVNSRDIVNFRRMINKPTRGIGPTSVEKIENFLPSSNGDVFAAMNKAVTQNVLSARCTNSVKTFIATMEESYNMIDEGNLGDGVKYLLDKLGLIQHFMNEDKKNNTFKVENLNSLVNAISEYPSTEKGLLTFLEEVTLDRTKIGLNEEPQEEGVTLITIHNTKGLEFEDVYVAGLEEKLFPNSMSDDEEGIEEERRLFYVAATRAKFNLYLFSAKSRRVWGRMEYDRLPSRFLDEIEEDQVEVIGFPNHKSPSSWDDKASKYLNNRGDYNLLDEKRYTHAPRHGIKHERTKPNIYKNNSNFPEDPSSLIHKGFGVSSKSFEFEKNDDEAVGYNVGDRVNNKEKGEGQIVSSINKNGRKIIEVEYDTGVIAKYIAKYAKFTKI